ncbi:MAG TPA: BON domain-containing protein [Armatimonadota bacterium]|nr:BON domain-containing protein [Armatimonadota bacterium]
MSDGKDLTYIPEDFPGVTTPEGAPVSDEPLREDQILAALEKDDRVNEHLITVTLEGDTVYLTGRQDTVQARDAATEVARSAAGGLTVINDLEIRPSA